MERTISLTELRGAVDEAYELFKDEHSGSVDPRIKNTKENAFGISLVLTDGTVINKGDADVPSPIGAISKIPASVALLSQMSPADLIKKSGICFCRCCGGKARKPDIPLSSHGIRAVSAIEPTGDADGKWEVIINNMINLIGSAPELDDDLYKALTEEAAKANVENVIAEAGYTLYDDAPIAIDLYIRQMAMTATSEQLATMCATIAADGRNPKTGEHVFDGCISPTVTALMAVHGPHKEAKPWMVATGLPAKSGFGGAIAGVLPGVFGIAAYSPELNEAGVSIKAAQAIRHIMQKLQLSVFASAKVSTDTTK